MDLFVPFALVSFMVLLILFGSSTGYSTTAIALDVYPYFTDVHIFVFFGFGFLMAFLNRNGVTSTGHSLVAAAFAALWGILNRGLWWPLIEGLPIEEVELNLNTLLYGEFAAAVVLVSLGALVGRLSAVQTLALAFIEVPVYTINVALSEGRYRVRDYGGALQIFLFGALFGLSCSYVLDAKASRSRPGAVIRSSRASDMLALLGTLFMWCFFPSFNAAATVDSIRQYSVLNTYLALAMGTLMTFTAQHMLWDGKFNMNEVQYATLAGGVAMGAVSSFAVQPFGALLIGSLSSLLSVLGYRYLTPYLSRRFFLNDTCGVINAFAIPGLAGGIASVIAAGAAIPERYEFSGSFGFLIREQRSASRQAGFQLLLIATSIGFPLVSGAITGFILSFFGNLQTFYDDREEFVDPISVTLS